MAAQNAVSWIIAVLLFFLNKCKYSHNNKKFIGAAYVRDILSSLLTDRPLADTFLRDRF